MPDEKEQIDLRIVMREYFVRVTNRLGTRISKNVFASGPIGALQNFYNYFQMDEDEVDSVAIILMSKHVKKSLLKRPEGFKITRQPYVKVDMDG